MSEDSIRTGDIVRMNDAYRRAIRAAEGLRNGEVLDIHDDTAEVNWVDRMLPRQVPITKLEKIVRATKPDSSTDKAGGFSVGDAVRFKPEFLRSIGQVASETARLRGTILELKPLGENAKATVEWSNGRTHAVLTSHLVRANVRERG